MATRLLWYGDRIQSQIYAESERRLDASAILILNRVRVLLSTPGPSRSRPGEAPHKQRGTLRASYTRERNGALSRRVGSGLINAKILEFGGRRVAPRPHLRPAYRDSIPAINALWARPLNLR